MFCSVLAYFGIDYTYQLVTVVVVIVVLLVTVVVLLVIVVVLLVIVVVVIVELTVTLVELTVTVVKLIVTVGLMTFVVGLMASVEFVLEDCVVNLVVSLGVIALMLVVGTYYLVFLFEIEMHHLPSLSLY